MDITLPPGSILISLNRDETEMVPKGNTVLKAGDVLILCALIEGDAPPDITLVEKVIEEEDYVPNMTIATMPHRPNALIVLIQRDGDYIIPDGSTTIELGDRLLINYTDETVHAAAAR